jgi:hypothetical protein
MKAKLIKTPEQLYKLKFYNDEDMLACATALLSKQNCDSLFGVVDVEKLAEQFMIDESYGKQSTDLWKGYLFGFNKALQLNKDKVFTLEDMLKAYEKGASFGTTKLGNTHYFDELTQSLQQPTEIEVEIEMECIDPNCDSLNRKGCCIPGDKPKLDSEGCLIIKKK